MGKADKGRIEALEARLIAAEALMKRVAELEGQNAQLQERVDFLERQADSRITSPLWADTSITSSLKKGKPVLDRGASGVYNLIGDAEDSESEEAEGFAEAIAEAPEVTVDDAEEKGNEGGGGAAAAESAGGTGSSAGLGSRVLSPGKMIRSASAYSDDGGDRYGADRCSHCNTQRNPTKKKYLYITYIFSLSSLRHHVSSLYRCLSSKCQPLCWTCTLSRMKGGRSAAHVVCRLCKHKAFSFWCAKNP